ncbi:hypothetical protein DNH61_06030 [Paenibacillus sambharensis]|uniref:FAD/FMN-containing dehydrogenase n=1 Tax=Paenibacillus sambharensis TaxID=1803190 RepID=A0A2W1LD75_9BACL|nr:hypothetical protein [Paenibacillus sambharensis]PZD96753.1 hypothetical protein DNH61_06030 [Paenibacillus sambharensis]
MKKKAWIIAGAVIMVMAFGTGVYAAADGGAAFKEMLPFMQKMHPDMTEQQLEEMHNKCHDSGMMKNMGQMMNGNGGI